MELGHTGIELCRQVAPAEMNVVERGLNTSMAGELGNLMQLPTGLSQIRQTEMAEGVGGQAMDCGPVSNALNDFRPCPDRNRLRAIAV